MRHSPLAQLTIYSPLAETLGSSTFAVSSSRSPVQKSQSRQSGRKSGWSKSASSILLFSSAEIEFDAIFEEIMVDRKQTCVCFEQFLLGCRTHLPTLSQNSKEIEKNVMCMTRFNQCGFSDHEGPKQPGDMWLKPFLWLQSSLLWNDLIKCLNSRQLRSVYHLSDAQSAPVSVTPTRSQHYHLELYPEYGLCFFRHTHSHSTLNYTQSTSK